MRGLTEPVPAPLAGRAILVTRPQAQAGPLSTAIAAAGGEAVLFPLLEIVALPDDPACAQALAAAPQAAWAIFISPNAVAYGVPRLLARGPWPAALLPAAVGQGTARALRDCGFARVLAPESGFDSEALLACPELAAPAVAGRTVLLFKGEGGRDLLAATLQQRGAIVLPAPCYRRLPPAGDIGAVLARVDAGRLHGVVLSSSEVARHFAALLPPARRGWLSAVPVFCPHPRIAEAAAAIGCGNVCLTAPGDAGIVAGLSTYNWPPV